MRRRLELPALSHQQPGLPPSPCTRHPEEHEIMKERASRWLMRIMIIIVVITVLLVRSCNDRVAFTHGFLDTSEFVK